MMLKTPVFIINSFTKGFTLGHLGCQIFSVMGTVSGIGASTTNACIAYDRYNTIARPFDGRLTHTKAILMVTLIYCYTIPCKLLSQIIY